MSDTYNHGIPEQCSESTVAAPEGGLPEQFKTVLGKMVKLTGKPFSDTLALITYSSSKIQGNALIRNEIEDVESLIEISERLYEDGVLENEDLEECDSIILPIDGLTIDDRIKGVIVDCDLRSYTNGLQWLLNPDGDVAQDTGNIGNVLRSLLVFIKTMRHLRDKGFVFSRIDGHHFFFNTEYGEFQFVFDGVDIAQTENIADDYDNKYQHVISYLILYFLTGTKIDAESDTTVALCYPSEDDAEENLGLDQELIALGGSSTSLRAWNALPGKVRNALFDSFFAETVRDISPDEWEALLREAIAEVEVCTFCGHTAFKTAKQCIFCGNTTEKADLLTRWLIESSSQPKYLKIEFGRGTTLPGEILGIHLSKSEFMRLMYNSKTNVLGLKNMSSISWFIMEDGNQKEIAPGKVVSIENELSITFDGYPNVLVRFLGYNTK